MNKILLVLLGGCLTIGSVLHGVTQIGNGDLYLDSRLNFAYDSNLFLRETDKRSDSMFLLYGGVGFIQHERSVLNLEAEIGYEITEMDEFKSEDAEDFKSNFTLSYPNNIERNGYFEISGGLNEITQANADIGQRIEIEAFDIQGLFEQQVSDKVGIEFSAGRLDEDYANGLDPSNGFALDRESELLSFGLAGTYVYSEKLVTVFQYTHRDLEYNDDVSIQQKGDILSVGVRGQISPKVSGGISIGFQDISLDSDVIGNDSYTDPFYSVDLEWAPRDKTTVSIVGSNNFQASVYGDVNNRTEIGFQVNEALSDKATLSVGMQFSDNDYDGLFERVDESVIFTAGYFFQFDELTQFNAQLTYEDRDSTLSGLGFNRFYGIIGVSKLW